MPAVSLTNLARKACVKNIKSITDVGDMPYSAMRCVLVRVDNPDQLRQIELASPQICGADAELWREFIKRDVPGWEKVPHEPKNPQSCYKVYRKLVADSIKQEAQDADMLKSTLDGIRAKQAKNVTKKVELNIVKTVEGMKAEGETIALPRSSTFFRREQNTKGFDASILRYEKECGPLAEILQDHKYHRYKSPEEAAAPPKPKSKLDKFRKEARAMNPFAHRDQPGVISTERSPAKMTAPPFMVANHRQASSPKPIDPTRLPTSTRHPTPPVQSRTSRETDTSSKPTKPARLPNPPVQSRKRPREDDSSSQPIDATAEQRKRPKPSTSATRSQSSTAPTSSATGGSYEAIARALTASPTVEPLKPQPMRLKPKKPVNIFMPVKRRVT